MTISTQGETAQGILKAIENMGCLTEAQRWRSVFDSKGWDHVDQQDVLGLLGALQQLATVNASQASQASGADNHAQALAEVEQGQHASTLEEESSVAARPTPSGPLVLPRSPSRLPDSLRALAYQEAFVHTVDPSSEADSIELVDAVARLLGSRVWDNLKTSVRKIFVEFLGYEANEIDETLRVRSLSSIDRVVQIASHDDFAVVVAASQYAGSYVTHWTPVLRLHPASLIFAFQSTTGHLKLIWSDPRLKNGIASKALVGTKSADQPDELLIVARRFALLRPLPGERGPELSARIHRQWQQPAVSLAPAWCGTAVNEVEACGATWPECIAEEIETFCQIGCTPSQRIHTGLEALLRDRFPIYVARRRSKKASERKPQARLDLVGWEITGVPSTHEEAWTFVKTRQSRSLLIDLSLRLSSLDTSSVSDGLADPIQITLPCELAIPGAKGELVLEGAVHSLWINLGSVRSGAHMEDEDGEDEDGDEDEDDGEDNHQEAQPGHDTLIESPGARSAHGRGQPTSAYELWGTLVSAKLANLALRLFQLYSVPTTAEALLLVLGRGRHPDRPYSLLSLSALWGHLSPRHEPGTGRARLVNVADARPRSGCAVLGSELPAGHWIPIASARPHPCGGLATPRLVDNEWRLGTQVRENRDGGQTWWWRAATLSWFRNANVQDIRRPALLDPGRATQTTVTVLHGEALRIVTSNAQLGSPTPSVSIRSLDIPASRSDSPDAAPRFDVQVGQRVSGGDKWLEVPQGCWPTRRSANAEDGTHILELARRRLFKEKDSLPWGHKLHLGPDEHGIVVETAMHPILGKLGGVAGTRASIKIQGPKAAAVVALPDGRMAAVETIASQDMPYTADGEVPRLLLYDPQASQVHDGAEELLDGCTGEILGTTATMEVLLVGGSRPGCGPDPHLRYRWIDGDGIPSDESAPSMTTHVRRWLAAAHPEVSDRCARAEKLYAQGHAPVLAGLTRLLLGAGLEPLSEGPLGWQVATGERAAMDSTYDPTVPSPHNYRGEGDLDSEALSRWRCRCGAMRGRAFAVVVCSECEDRVSYQPVQLRDSPQHVIPLAAPVLHPWRAPAASGLLGLTERELRSLLVEFDPTQVRMQMQMALERPLAAATRRLELEPQQGVRESVAHGANQLRQLLAQCEGASDCGRAVLDRLWLTCVPVIPELGRMVGAPPGSPSLLCPEILVRYRRVRLASKVVENLENVTLEDLASGARELLQRAVDRLYGSCHCPRPGLASTRPGFSSLAELLMRVWPTTRHPDLRLTIPGHLRLHSDQSFPDLQDSDLFCDLSIDELQDQLAKSVEESEATDTAAEHTSYLLDAQGLHLLPTPYRPINRKCYGSWQSRSAYGKLAGPLLPRLLALGCACERLQIDKATWLAWGWPDSVPRRVIGRLVLRELWRGLGQASSAPEILVELIDRSRVLELPTSTHAAIEHLMQHLRRVLPVEDDLGMAIVRTCLSRVLCGWSRAPLGVASPESGRWHGAASEQQKGRVLPSRAGPLWTCLPGYVALHSPVEWLAQGDRDDLRIEVVRAAMRLQSVPVPQRWWRTSATGTSKIRQEPRPWLTPSVPPQEAEPQLGTSSSEMPPSPSVEKVVPLARVFTESIHNWLNGKPPTP